MYKLETLQEAYKLAKENKGAPGVDWLSFQDIEERETNDFLQQIQEELLSRSYLPRRNRKKSQKGMISIGPWEYQQFGTE